VSLSAVSFILITRAAAGLPTAPFSGVSRDETPRAFQKELKAAADHLTNARYRGEVSLKQELTPRSHVTYEVVWPSGRFVSKPVNLASPVLDLNGKTVCEIWDGVFKGDQMYPIINAELKRKYPDIRIIDCATMGNSHGTNEREYVADLPNLLREFSADAVISAVGA
jgi:hypothetical protein